MVFVGIKLPDNETTTGDVDDDVRGQEVLVDDAETVVCAIIDGNDSFNV